MTGEHRAIGKSITGVCNMLFLVLLVTGSYLWFPRQWSRRAFKAVAIWNPSAKGRARDWNWHHVFGLWLGPILLCVIVTGVFMSYSWPRAWVNRAFGNGQTELAGPQNEGREGRRTPGRTDGGRLKGGRMARASRSQPQIVSLDTVYMHAAPAVPGWVTMQIRMPRRAGSPLTVSMSTTSDSRPDLRQQLTLDAATGVITKREGYATYTTARKITSWIRGIHTGEAGGMIGQTLAGLASLAGVMLVWTGLALAWRRLRAFLARRRASARSIHVPGAALDPALAPTHTDIATS
jgi:uncharacterized iron-regulated membrane protein